MNIMTQQASGDFTGEYSVSQPISARLTDTTPMEQFLKDIERRAFHMARMATGSRDDALDIVQDAMYKLVEKYSAKSADEWRPLFYRILNSKITDYYRRNGVKNRLISLASWGMKPDELGGDLIDRAEGRNSETPDQMLVRELQIKQLTTAVKKLPTRQREGPCTRCVIHSRIIVMTKPETNISDKQLAGNLRDNLLEQEHETASEDLFRLAQARNNALSQSRQGRKPFFWPALGTSLASVALIIAVLINPAEQIVPSDNISITDIQADEPIIDLYEDLDFYDWLASAET